MKVFIINGDNINSIETFYKEINQTFMKNESFQITNLDGLEDLFNGGVGELSYQEDDESIQIIWKQFKKNENDLGRECTIKWYEFKLQTIPHNSDYFKQEIQQLQQGIGTTFFDIVLEIINEHQNIVLIKE